MSISILPRVVEVVAVKICLRHASRLSTRSRPTVASTKKKKSDCTDQSPPRSVFAFGKFSQLNQPSRKIQETLSVGLNLITSFDALRIFPTVRAAIVGQIKAGYNVKSAHVKSIDDVEIKPSPIQIAAIRKISRPRTSEIKRKLDLLPSTNSKVFEEVLIQSTHNRLKVFTLAAETGLGKTWAYLAPLLSKLKEADFDLFSNSPSKYAARRQSPHIRSVILVPTHELVEQVYETLQGANHVPFDAALLNAPANYKEFLSLPENLSSLGLSVFKWGSGDAPSKLFDACLQGGRMDVVVTTPAKVDGLRKLIKYHRPTRFFSLVDFCVMDEADTLLDNSFKAELMLALRAMPECTDLVLCLATVPKEFKKTLSQLFPHQDTLIQVATPALHKIPPLIAVKIIDASISPYNGLRNRCLAQAIYAIAKDGTEPGNVKRILVFVNSKKDVRPLADELVNKFYHRPEDVVGVTGDMKPNERTEAMQPFLGHAMRVEDDIDKSEIKILITTDLMARGVDFGGIKNVVLMDLPRSLVDLVHRIGRTGRMRQSGRVFVIVDRKTRKLWIRGLPNAIKRGFLIG